MSVDHSIISLDVCIKGLVVEDAGYCAVESVHSGVVYIEFLASEALPELNFGFALVVLHPGEHPGMRTLSIGAQTNKGVQTESQEKVAQQSGVILTVTAALGQESLHRVPNLNLLRTRSFDPLERDQADKSRGVKRTVQQPISNHWLNEGAHGFEAASIAVVSFSVDLDQSVFVRSSDLLVVVPPLVGIFEELVGAFFLELALEGDLFLNVVFWQELCLRKGGNQVHVELENSQGALLLLVYGEELGISFNSVAVEEVTPVDVFGCEHNWLLVGSVLEN